MENGLRALQTARAELVAATGNKGGHREKAIQLIDQAIKETKMGIAVGAL
jgi:DhnA family fructose-bisphosphate aldolase class Ia